MVFHLKSFTNTHLVFSGPLGRLFRGFRFSNPETNSRDVFFEGDCDAGACKLAEILGWTADLEEVVQAFDRLKKSTNEVALASPAVTGQAKLI